MKDSYLTAGIRLQALVRLLERNKVSYSPKYLTRLLFITQSAVWASLFSQLERARFGNSIDRQPLPEDPIFIIGHWRTGSTFLHQMMARDPRIVTPTLFQVAQPESFLISYRYFRPVFSRFVSRQRPMDMVKLGMDEPQEDEYAIYRMTRFSPLEKLVFPDSCEYFLNRKASFLPPDALLDEWTEDLKRFFRRLSFHAPGRIVSKNPFNSLRVTFLAGLFPKARFIHIIRNPLDVVPSSIHMWEIVQRQNCLNRNRTRPTISEVARGINWILDEMEAQLSLIPPERHVRIRFEEIEQDPLSALKGLYRNLEMPFSSEFEANLLEFLAEVSGFRKNVFRLSASEREQICSELAGVMKRYGYA